MYLGFIPSIDCFVFLFGDNIQTAQPYRMIGSPMFFNSLHEAVEAAAFCGFIVYPDGRVSNAA